MGMMENIGTASAKDQERVLATLIAGLELEFGRDAGTALAHRFIDAEDIDFRWDARFKERWIGAYASVEDEDYELDRVAILGRLDGEWFVATMLVDGEGDALGMLGCRSFESRSAAERTFDRTR